MSIVNEPAQAVAEFPPALQALIQRELAAGNRIVAITSGFPASPVGAGLKLARPVTPRPRASDQALQFYECNQPDHSGEFTDAKRHFFVLEPPLSPAPELDLNALRAEREARQRAADAALRAEQEREAGQPRAQARRGDARPAVKVPPPLSAKPSSVLDRFPQSMEMNCERWHDGVRYDLDLLKSATPEERAQIEQLLLSDGVRGWRGVEALAALDTPRAHEMLRQAFACGDDQLNMALLSHAPNLCSAAERMAALVSALQNTKFYGGLTQALDLVERHHPPEIVAALLEGVLRRPEELARHLAAMLSFLHGRAAEPFDVNLRPFFRRLHREDRGEREATFRELCATIGVNSTRWVTPAGGRPPA